MSAAAQPPAPEALRLRVLVAAASRYGATTEIAEAIARGLNERGLEAEAVPAGDVRAVAGYDALVIGSAVYYGHWLDAAQAVAHDHAADPGRPVWLFSSGPLGQPGHLLPEGDAVDVAGLVETTHAVEHRTFAGRLDRSRLKLREKAIVSALHAPEGDFRDWDAIDAFAAAIAEHLRGARGAG